MEQSWRFVHPTAAATYLSYTYIHIFCFNSLARARLIPLDLRVDYILSFTLDLHSPAATAAAAADYYCYVIQLYPTTLFRSLNLDTQ